MSRSGYSYEGSEWDCIRWQGVIKSAIRAADAFLKWEAEQ